MSVRDVILWPDMRLHEVCRAVETEVDPEKCKDFADAWRRETLQALEIALGPDRLQRFKDLDAIQKLATDLVDTMCFCRGDGLAACQIGELVRMCVVNRKATADLAGPDGKPADIPIVLVNPRIVEKSGDQQCQEGCLSFPTFWIKSTRRKRVVVEYLDLECRPQRLESESDYMALALQHEIDHLDGRNLSMMVGDLKRLKMRNGLKALKRIGWKYEASTPTSDPAFQPSVDKSPIAKPTLPIVGR